jgi:hypothetical protein
MKFFPVLVLSMVIVTVFLMAGCSSTPSGPGTSAVSPGAASPKTSVRGADLFGDEKFGWYYYRSSGNYTYGTVKGTILTTISREVYNGTPAVHYVTDIRFANQQTGGTDHAVFDVYIDNEMKTLGGEVKGSQGGKENRAAIPAGHDLTEVDKSFSLDTPPLLNKSAVYQFIGPEPVTVGAGSFPAALHYTSPDTQAHPEAPGYVPADTDYWIAPGVPLFLKAITYTPEGSGSVELLGWGAPGTQAPPEARTTDSPPLK